MYKSVPVRLGAVRARIRVEDVLAAFLFCVCLSSPGLASAATLSGTFANLTPGTTVNLSDEGQLDWRHWGLMTEWSSDHKYGVAPQISASFITDPYFLDGPYPLEGGMIAFNWTNGTPSRVVTNTVGGVYIFGDRINPGSVQTGFQIQCPADTNPKRLRIYAGTSGVAATFTANLSGALPYADNSLDGSTGPLYRAYTLDFQADSPGQVLTVEFQSTANNFVDQYLILQAATLSGTDEPPQATITAPADGASFTAPATFPLSALATDGDGTITNLTLLSGSTPLADSPTNTIDATLQNQPAGAYDLLAVAKDDAGLSITSFPVTVYVVTNGGTLNASVETPPSNVDLTMEGTADWAHWGLSSPGSFNHKAGVAQLIPNLSLLNASPASLTNYYDSLTACSWSDGTPTAAAYGSTAFICLYPTNTPPAGFQLTVPATNLLRRLKVYLGLYAAQGRLDARLSDFSALPYSDTSVFRTYGSAYAVYTFTFASANPGANLVVTWTPAAVYDPFYGNLTWQAATLWEQPPPPVLQVVSPPPVPDVFALSLYAHTGWVYTVQFLDALGSTNWQTLSNFPGESANVLITDPAPGPLQRFYRALVE